MTPRRRPREDNRAVLKKVNRVSSGRRKPGMDGIKIALVMLGLMAAVALAFIFIGNLDLSNIGAEREEPYNNGDAPPSDNGDVPRSFYFGDYAAVPMLMPEPGENRVFYHEQGGVFELPIVGASGWAATETALRDSANGAPMQYLSAGQGFVILGDSGDWWRVRLPDGIIGWVDNRHCFINLPDILPSIIYRIPNASESLFRSVGYALENITGYAQYSAHTFNYRLGRYEYIVPAMLTMARALHVAQQLALSRNHTLVICEAFRPRRVHNALLEAMTALLDENEAVYRAFADSLWSLSWFVPSGLTNHQRAAAVDVTLARAYEAEFLPAGPYSFLRITRYSQIDTGAPMHEFSPAAAIVAAPQGMTAAEVLADTVYMNGAAMTSGIAHLQWILANAGFNPLASKWWHFNHMPSVNMANSAGITGDFYTETIYSVPPG